ncbi:YHS domain-containing protein [Thermosulfuriphilus ammonigenes]|uniref:YHS domain-containing protein n=1 Tax=Thermosulfuriphilus ammonigenes TaxID=1936021 RepID=A0A6G7PVS8_9BACT|nr:YHS domain-containing protein [Thermosulfuriphilus ammonigenes]MBA2848208.1 YHS domain-containing protein [Thermosulfuriphilus ammonigenes]QIJ71621.1 YHS domain-containing protein [Thermosulfuriphilus ammonigenes]
MILRILLIILAAIILYYLFWAPGKKKPAHRKKGKILVKDPVCGLYIPEDEALKYEAGKHTYYFCSPSCQETFIKNQSKGKKP